MNINFLAVDETYIKQKVESGFYSNVTELVRNVCWQNGGKSVFPICLFDTYA
jgi:hypothetical protein